MYLYQDIQVIRLQSFFGCLQQQDIRRGYNQHPIINNPGNIHFMYTFRFANIFAITADAILRYDKRKKGKRIPQSSAYRN